MKKKLNQSLKEKKQIKNFFIVNQKNIGNILNQSSCNFLKKIGAGQKNGIILLIFLVMDLIDMGYFLNMSSARLMIKIWESSYHVHHFPSDQNCNCQEYLNLCIDAAREVWDNENYIFFDSALYRFQLYRKKLVCLMSLKNEEHKEQLVEGILRGER